MEKLDIQAWKAGMFAAHLDMGTGWLATCGAQGCVAALPTNNPFFEWLQLDESAACKNT